MQVCAISNWSDWECCFKIVEGTYYFESKKSIAIDIYIYIYFGYKNIYFRRLEHGSKNKCCLQWTQANQRRKNKVQNASSDISSTVLGFRDLFFRSGWVNDESYKTKSNLFELFCSYTLTISNLLRKVYTSTLYIAYFST